VLTIAKFKKSNRNYLEYVYIIVVAALLIGSLVKKMMQVKPANKNKSGQ
jgi:hypothetical protein